MVNVAVAAAAAATVISLKTAAYGENMNGDYMISRTDTFGESMVTDYASRSMNYFDVWSPEISTRYGEVFWTMMDPVALPPDVVEQFKDGTIAITGYEMDQLDGDGNSIPYNRAYNHHYMAYIVGEGADMAMVDCHASHDHGCYEGKKVLRPVPKSENEQFSNTFFSEGNGGESRKSFHGYPNGYAQLISSPKEFHLEPMQIDTWNRDNPSLEFVAGPEPAASQAPPGASYSGILECPCTDRISKVNGSICSDDFGCLPFNLACLEEPGSTLISNGNKICNLDTYNGGQQCCPHQSILLDRDQNPWPDVKQTYRLKFRFYYQAYVPTADRVSASHQDLRRLYWQTEAWAGEYDIPPGAESYGHDDGATAMTDDGQYTYTITSEWTAGEMIDLDDCDWRNTSACSGQYKDSEGVYMVYAGGHCHAPNCVSIELWNQDTGELYCRQLPMFGKGDITNDKFDDKGYATLPPCVWSDDASEDLPTRPRVPFDAKLYSVAVQNSTYGHTGQMASWQMRGALYY